MESARRELDQTRCRRRIQGQEKTGTAAADTAGHNTCRARESRVKEGRLEGKLTRYRDCERVQSMVA